MTRTRQWQQGAIYLILSVLALMVLFPFYFMMQTSVKDAAQFARQYWLPPLPWHFENYALAFPIIAHYMLNSVIVTSASTAGVLLVATPAAYAFARMRFRGRTLLYYTVIALLAIPPILTLVPLFILVRDFGIINTLWGLIVPYVATGEALSIFVLRTFFAGLPEELFEAATIDGASAWQAFVRIALPLVRPALGTVAIIQVLAVWNDYVWPLLVVSDDSVKTLVVGLVSFMGRYQTQWGALMAGYTLASLPVLILFFFTVRQFVTGLTSGALKL